MKNYHHKKLSPQKTPDRAEGFSLLVTTEYCVRVVFLLSSGLGDDANTCKEMTDAAMAAAALLLLLFVPVAACTSAVQLPRSCYIHIPFCRRRCFYCNFPVTVVGERPSTQQQSSEEYTTLLLREMRAELAIESLQQPAAVTRAPAPLQTVYFGGGTPSLLRTGICSQKAPRAHPTCTLTLAPARLPATYCSIHSGRAAHPRPVARLGWPDRGLRGHPRDGPGHLRCAGPAGA